MTARSTVGAIRHFATSCGLLLIPAVVWNLLLTDRLPSASSSSVFWRDIPRPLSLLENVSRTLVFAAPFLMPLDVAAPGQRRRMVIFAAGTLVYFASWLPLIAAPSSPWSTSAVGFLAPAYTPALWLFGLALLGRRLFWGDWYRWWMYLPLAAIFLLAHVGHTWLIFVRSR
jgi:hypothetical protein